METEFIPLDAINRAMKIWWLIALAGILGGVVGFTFSRVNPPMYESQAVYQANLDFTQASQFITPNNLTLSQYDEDLALEAVHAALWEVQPTVVAAANSQGIPLAWNQFIANATIERDHAFWKIRFRNSNPKIAQTIVSIWVDQGTQAMHTEQIDGRMKNYVFFELVSPASLPVQPLYFRTNQVVLAGGLAGLVIGILLTNLPIFTGRKETSPLN